MRKAPMVGGQIGRGVNLLKTGPRGRFSGHAAPMTVTVGSMRIISIAVVVRIISYTFQQGPARI
jgi:hypothetical protein